MQKVSEDEIMAMHGGGMTVSQIAAEVGMSSTRVYQVLVKLGLTPNRPTSRITPEMEQTIIERYIEGVPVPKIASEAQIDYAQIYKILRANEIPTRRGPEGKSIMQERLDMAIEMYQKGTTIADIVNETGIYQPRLHLELRRRNVPLRRDMHRGGESSGPDAPKKSKAKKEKAKKEPGNDEA